MSQNKSAAIKAIKQQQQQQAQAAQAHQGKNGTASREVPPAAAASAAAPSSAGASKLGSRSVRGGGRWTVDLLADRASVGALVATSSGLTSSDLLPGGFTAATHGHSSDAREDEKARVSDDAKQADLLYKSAMALAQAPGKQLMMTAFMLWMSGNSLQIFSIMMLGMALWTPIGEIFNVHTRFARYADSGIDLILPKLTFIAMNLAGLAVGLYKCNTMGLLPTSQADWIDMGVRASVQVAGGGIIAA